MTESFSRERAVYGILCFAASISGKNVDIRFTKKKYFDRNKERLFKDIYPLSNFNKGLLYRYIERIIERKSWHRVKSFWKIAIDTISQETTHVRYKVLQSVIKILCGSGDLQIVEQRFLKLLFKELKIDRTKFNKFLRYQNNIVIEDKFTFKQKLPIINKESSFKKTLRNLLVAVISVCCLLVGTYLLSMKYTPAPSVELSLNMDNSIWPYFSKGFYSDDALCIEPLKKFKIKPDILENPFAREGELDGKSYNLKNRFLVADLEAKDRNGICKGVKEIIPQSYLEKHPELESVVIKPDSSDCRGQTISLCEKKENTIRLVARFVISSGVVQRTYYNYYTPIMLVRTRNGDGREENFIRDSFLNGDYPGTSSEKLLKYENKIPMPNFMQFVPYPGMKGETQNGIHRYPFDKDKKYLGKPSSQGCFRTSDVGTRFIRDWVPLGAKLFVLHNTVTHPLTHAQ